MNKLKKMLYDIGRKCAKGYLTNNLGKVVEDASKITCYVKNSKVKKKGYCYDIACFGVEDEQKKIAECYKLDKPICYVIDGLNLKNKTYIYGYNNCEIIIRNCNFGLDLRVSVNGKCTLDNTNINTFSHLSISANDLTVKNMSSDQIRIIGPKSHIGFSADDRIELINSNIGTEIKDIKFSFTANNSINIVNSNIIGKEIECETNKIDVDKNSSLTATEKVALKVDDFDKVNVNAPKIVLNGKKVSTKEKTVVLKKVTDLLLVKRLELVNLLRKVKNECEIINSKKVSEYEKELKIKPVIKVLKK